MVLQQQDKILLLCSVIHLTLGKHIDTYCAGHTNIFNDERIMMQTSPTIYFKSFRPPLHNISQIEIDTFPQTRLVMLIINKPRLPPIHLNRPGWLPRLINDTRYIVLECQFSIRHTKAWYVIYYLQCSAKSIFVVTIKLQHTGSQ